MSVWPFAPRANPENSQPCSPQTADYNCLAFAAGDTGAWWEPYVIPPTQPGIYWPQGVKPDNGIEDWEAALATVGFVPCADGAFDSALVKVAILGFGTTAEHATRQLVNGKWVSKLGNLEDIEHDAPETIGGGDYGEVLRFLCRPRKTEDP